ncbi:uncharacterized protein BX663DRAFT_553400 [Cokeromyces recurvatus]|uniref:uncharacterized protein n=1 Tax=Cokeromyces recurvatus TaxID=90255 RepID=UPI00221FE38E|nr:uncharacterized protein BX663DRAFT_553400 [Cokeromyces recurvatus]KAI7901161.1 hypothetical protein BX663DRAFT_553400 [Cokeromyces recurvatus]
MESNTSDNNNSIQASSSSTETNKKRNNNRRRYNNNKREKKEEKSRQHQKKKEPLKSFIKKKLTTNPEEVNADEEGEVCFICTRPIDYYAVAPCDHRTCHLCTLRLRVLYKTNNCAYCKMEAKQVIFTNVGEKPYEDYKPEDTPFYDKKYGIKFETKDMYKEMKAILQYNCPEQDCEEAFENWTELKRHVKKAHERLCCDLCLRNKKIFSHEHTLYTQAQIQKHYREGDASFNKDDETGFTGHPECVFCRTRFYGADELFEHCRDKHEQCHLCVRRGIQHQYYANYDSLEKHFKKEHYLCPYQECLNNKFVVFDSDIDLKAHEVKEHGNLLSRQQRAKQSEARRVDVNLSYAGSPHQQQRSNNSSRNSNPVNLASAEEFPNIDGSTTTNNVTALLASRLASTVITPQEEWPMLGEENNSNVASGRSSPIIHNHESDTVIVSRHAAALDRIADIFKNVEKVIKFRQLVTGFTSLSTNTATFVNSVYDLCDKDAGMAAKVLTGAKDLIDNQSLKSDMIRTWNQKKNSSSPLREDENDGSHASNVLVVNLDNQRSQQQKRKNNPGYWDKVASAAINASSSSSSRTYHSTPWSGASSSRTNSENDLQALFPALPSSAASSSRRVAINSMIRRTNNTNAWGGEPSSISNNPNDSELSDNNDTINNRKKKGKKGKQVLFRVGL